MNKLTNAVVFIIIGLVFVTVVVSSVSTYQYNANGWDNDTRETVRGSGITYNELFDDFNEIRNFDFSNGTTEWTAIDATLTVTNKVLIVTSTSTTPYAVQINVLNDNHIYYINTKVKPEKLGAEFIYWADGSPETLMGSKRPTTLDWITFSSRSNSGDNNGKFMLQYAYSIDSGDKFFVDGNSGVYVIDLTETFGSGNEPSKTDLDSWFNDYTYLKTHPDNTLKTLDGMVDFIPILFIIILVAGAVLFIKTKES